VGASIVAIKASVAKFSEPPEDKRRNAMTKVRRDQDELVKLSERLQQIRQEWLLASRKGDYRAVARLTGETARVNRAIREAEVGKELALDRLGDTLFSSTEEEEEAVLVNREESLV
jgi:hypothetical protein